jgi:hypothetical protein
MAMSRTRKSRVAVVIVLPLGMVATAAIITDPRGVTLVRMQAPLLLADGVVFTCQSCGDRLYRERAFVPRVVLEPHS